MKLRTAFLRVEPAPRVPLPFGAVLVWVRGRRVSLIAILPKNAREELRIAIAEYRGHRFVDVRVYARADGAEAIPTRAGVTVRFENLQVLCDALRSAQETARAAGYLELDGGTSGKAS